MFRRLLVKAFDTFETLEIFFEEEEGFWVTVLWAVGANGFCKEVFLDEGAWGIGCEVRVK